MDVDEQEDFRIKEQLNFAKQQYRKLHTIAILKATVYAIPAMIISILAMIIYFKNIEDIEFRNEIYHVDNNLTVLLAGLALIFWGLFFWLQVHQYQKRAHQWEKAQKAYIDLVKQESQYKSAEERRLASRKFVSEIQEKTS